MKVIGLCGGSGSGKSAVCRIFNEFGIISIDADQVYHNLISSNSACSRELISTFGDEIRSTVGIDRGKLREVVFTTGENIKLLNKITHKHILNKVRELIEEISKTSDTKAVIFDAPLLFESGFDKECDLTVCVIADEETRVERIIKRDSISREEAIKRIRAQISNEELIKKCDYSIENNSTEESLREEVLKIKQLIIDNN